MNYLNIYNNICNRGKFDRGFGYSEKHHIIPKCVGGDESLNNLTILTAKEHYIAHLLLTKIYTCNRSIIYAFFMMKVNNSNQKRYKGSREYELLRKTISDNMKMNNPMQNRTTKDKMISTRKRKIATGEIQNPMNSDSARSKISQRMKERNPIKLFPEKHNFKNKSYTKGTVWVTNKKLQINRRVHPSNIPEGYVLGVGKYYEIS